MHEHSSHSPSTLVRHGTVVPPTVDHQKRLIQQISIVLSTILFVIFAAYPIYISLDSVPKTITIMKPTLSTYTALYSEQPPMLTCTCSQPSIPSGDFIRIGYTLHQVCKSDFVTSSWISALAMTPGPKFAHDFRSTSSFSFQALTNFCQLAPTIIANSLLQLQSHPYVSVYITPLNLFEGQVRARINEFIFATTNTFLVSLSILRGQMQSNALLSSLQTNSMQTISNGTIQSMFKIYNNCNCAISPQCAMPSAIYAYPSNISVFDVPGFYTGCYITESLLQSDLRCFFNQTCFTQLQNFINPSPRMAISPLNPTLSTRYSDNTPIHVLVESLMVEQWNTTASYSSYYDACNPMQCTYEMMRRNDRSYIATMLIGLIGGLIAILNFVVPRVVKFFVYIVQKSEPVVVRTMTIISRQ